MNIQLLILEAVAVFPVSLPPGFSANFSVSSLPSSRILIYGVIVGNANVNQNSLAALENFYQMLLLLALLLNSIYGRATAYF